MSVPASTLRKLRRYADAFNEARQRRANEADTVMYLIKFFEEVLGYDSLAGQLTKELAIRDRYCDIALKPEGDVVVLVEVKAVSTAHLRIKHIEQAENYAARAGVTWVVLTNALEWRLYHLTFEKTAGITHELAFEVDLASDLDADAASVWRCLSLLSPTAISSGDLDAFWQKRKLLRPAPVVRALFAPEVLEQVRRQLNRESPAQVEALDVFNAMRDVVTKEAFMEAGDIRPPGRAPAKAAGNSARDSQARASSRKTGRGSTVSPRVRFGVTLDGNVVEIEVKGRPDTAERVTLEEVRDSPTRVAYGYTDRNLGPREVVGNKGGSLANKLRDLLRS